MVIGATGYIGAYILEQIVAAKNSFARIAIFTSPGTAVAKSQKLDELRASGVTVLVGDVKQEEDLLDAFKGIPPHRRT